VLIKSLGAYGYGLWGIICVTMPILSMIFRLGAPFSIIRLFPAEDREEKGEGLSSVLLVVTAILIIFSVILLIFPEILANTVFDGHILIVQIVVFLVITHTLNELFISVFRALREMKTYSIINIAKRSSEVGSMVIAALLGYGIVGVILAVLGVYVISTFILLYMVRHRIKLRAPRLEKIKEYFSLSVPTVPAGISQGLVIMSDRYIIGVILGATYVGYYAPAYSYGEIIPKFVAGILGLVLFPTLSKHYEEGKISKVKNILTLCTKYFILFTVPFIIGFLAVGKLFLTRFTTPTVAANGYLILVLSSIVGLLMGLEIIFIQAVNMKKRTKLIGTIWVIAAVVNIGGNIIFIPKFGIMAAALTSIGSYSIVTGFALYFTSKHISLPLDFIMIGKIIFSAVLMGLTLAMVNIYVWQNLILLTVIGVVSYFIYLYLTKALTSNEINFIKNTFVP
ncbi:MAG: oligosaccharide flippase family protein, partial [Thermoplasmatota archaeon]